MHAGHVCKRIFYTYKSISEIVMCKLQLSHSIPIIYHPCYSSPKPMGVLQRHTDDYNVVNYITYWNIINVCMFEYVCVCAFMYQPLDVNSKMYSYKYIV